jgi:hypothetical protein
MRFVDDFFPLLVVVHGPRFDDGEFREMVDGYERYFERDERYAILTVSPGDSVTLGARERKLIADWANTPRVHEVSKRLCVGTATVVPSRLARGALTALLWFWTPASPFHPVTTVDEGLAFCFQSLERANVPLERPMDAVHLGVVAQLRASGTFRPSLRPAGSVETE